MSRHIDLSNHTHLRVIHFTEYMLDPHTTASQNGSWIPVILSQIATSCIEELVFHILILEYGQLDLFNWDALANILVETSFTQLRTIRFCPEMEVGDIGSLTVLPFRGPEVMDLIRSKLPTWAAGICQCNV
jgi:hypothetical protein